MTIPDNIALWLQNALRDLVRDDWTLGRMCFWPSDISEWPKDISDPIVISRWQISVDSIARCLDSELIAVLNYDHYSNQSAILADLQRYNPFDRSCAAYVWNGIFIYGSNKLAAIVKQFFMNDDEYAFAVNHDFIAVIANAFESSGAPWSDRPLIPVVLPLP